MDRTTLIAFSVLSALSAGFACANSSKPEAQDDVKKATQASAGFDQAASWQYLLKQCNFGPRKPGTPAHIQCRDWIKAEMEKNGCTNVRLQPFAHTWSMTRQKVQMWNIIGEQNWQNAKVRVVLLAHWDTRPTADQEFDEKKMMTPIIGANDGASGVAVLLELMKHTKALHPDLGFQFLMTDGEDLGPGLDEMFLGAAAYAKDYGQHKPNYGILLDMIGDKDLEVPMEPQSNFYAKPLVSAFYSFMKKNGYESTYPSFFGPTIEDDHIPLNKAGIPTMDLIDFSYPSWHTLDDTPDKCSAESLGKIGKSLLKWFSQPQPWAYPNRNSQE